MSRRERRSTLPKTIPPRPDLERLKQAACAARIRLKHSNFSWGMREMNVEDLDGRRLRFGSDATGPSDTVPVAEEP